MTAHRVFLAVLTFVLWTPSVTSAAIVDDDLEIKYCSNAFDDISKKKCSGYFNRLSDDALAYFFRAIFFKEIGEFERAINDLNRSLEISPQNNTIQVERIKLLLEKGEYDRVIAICTKSIESNYSEKNIYYYFRGKVRARKGDHSMAISDFTKSIELNNGLDADEYFERGMSFEASGKLQQAFIDFQKASELDLDHRDAADKVAELKQKLAKTGKPQPNPPTPTPVQASAPTAQTASAPAQSPPPAQPSAPLAQPSAPSTKRVALLIGNGSYDNAPRLENPARDVDLLERTFRAAGFAEVIVRKNLDQAGLMRELQAFRPIARKADVAIVYYAGHAIQMNGVNHLIPIDAKLKRDADVDLETVNASLILSAADGAGRLKIMILDACRDNPFANAMVRTAATRSIGRGLARVETSKGEYVAFSTREGSVAADGDGQNSPFAAALAKRIEQKPPLELRRLFDYVRDDVMSATGNNQQPFYYGSLPADLEFHFGR